MPRNIRTPENFFEMRRHRATGLEAVRARFHGHAFDMHLHDDEWLVGVTHSGLQDFYCRGRRRRSTPGRIILIEPGERHDGQSPNAEGFAYSMLYLPVDRLRGEMGGDGSIGFRDTLTSDPHLARALSGACVAVLDRGPHLVVEGLRDVVLNRLRAHLGVPRARPSAHDRGLAERAMDFLAAHFDEEISSQDLVMATDADSRFQLARAFRTRYGVPPHAYLVQLRIAKARRMVRDQVPLAEVAADCAFADQSHMTRWFRRAYGLSPGAYADGRTSVQDRH